MCLCKCIFTSYFDKRPDLSACASAADRGLARDQENRDRKNIQTLD